MKKFMGPLGHELLVLSKRFVENCLFKILNNSSLLMGLVR